MRLTGTGNVDRIKRISYPLHREPTIISPRAVVYLVLTESWIHRYEHVFNSSQNRSRSHRPHLLAQLHELRLQLFLRQPGQLAPDGSVSERLENTAICCTGLTGARKHRYLLHSAHMSARTALSSHKWLHKVAPQQRSSGAFEHQVAPWHRLGSTFEHRVGPQQRLSSTFEHQVPQQQRLGGTFEHQVAR